MAEGLGPGGALALGRYELRVELAKSQLGSLWVARAPAGNAAPWVAVRRIRTGPPLSGEDARRLSEAAMQSLPVRHPAISSVVDVVETEQELSIVSEYVDCEPIRSVIRLPSFRRRPFSVRVALLLATDVLEGLQAIHDQSPPGSPLRMSGGLSPDSILLGADGRVRLTDLGVAPVLKAIPKFASHPDLAAYACPEQLAFSSQVDERADVFTLGIVLWELMSGRRLFTAATHAAVSEKVRTGEVPRLDATRPLGGDPIPNSVADLVARALERDAGARFGSLAEMHAAIGALAGALKGTREELAQRVNELSGMTLAARHSALAEAPSAVNAPSGLPPPHGGTLLSSAPPKARRPPSHKHTLLGVAPPAAANASSVRPVSSPPSRPPSRPPSGPPSAAAASAASLIPSVKTPLRRSPTLLGVAPPPRPPSALEPPKTPDDFDLEAMRPSKPPFSPRANEAPAPAADGLSAFNELMASPESAGGARVPSLETPSAFDFMADRHEDNVATIPKPRDFDLNAFERAQTQRLGSFPPAPNSTPAPWSGPQSPAELRPPVAPAAARSLSEPPLAAPMGDASAATRVLQPNELPIPNEVLERRQRLRRVVAAVLAVTVVLLVCGLILAALRRHKDEIAETQTEPAPSAVASAPETPSAVPPGYAERPQTPSPPATTALALASSAPATPAPPPPQAASLAAQIAPRAVQSPPASAPNTALAKKSAPPSTTKSKKATPKTAAVSKKSTPKKSATTKKSTLSKQAKGKTGKKTATRKTSGKKTN